MRRPTQRSTRLVPKLVKPTEPRQSQESKHELATERKTTPIQLYHSPTVLCECPGPHGPRPLSGPAERRTPDERKSHSKSRSTGSTPNSLQQHSVLPMWTNGTFHTQLPSTTPSSARTSHGVDRANPHSIQVRDGGH